MIGNVAGVTESKSSVARCLIYVKLLEVELRDGGAWESPGLSSGIETTERTESGTV